MVLVSWLTAKKGSALSALCGVVCAI